MITLAQAVFACTWLTALLCLLQTLEQWTLDRRAELWPWPLLREEIRPAWFRSTLDFFFFGPRWTFLVGLRIIASLTLFVFPGGGIFLFLLLTQWGISLRWRGHYNGGSDSMTLVLLLGLTVAWWEPTEFSARLGLGFVAAQSVLSYFLAGVVKIRNRGWWNGRVLDEVLRFSSYAVPSWLRQRSSRVVTAPASWLVLSFELLFPLMLFVPGSAPLFLTLGFLFHLGNAGFLGLNLFWWAWIATYPALLYWAA